MNKDYRRREAYRKYARRQPLVSRRVQVVLALAGILLMSAGAAYLMYQVAPRPTPQVSQIATAPEEVFTQMNELPGVDTNGKKVPVQIWVGRDNPNRYRLVVEPPDRNLYMRWQATYSPADKRWNDQERCHMAPLTDQTFMPTAPSPERVLTCEKVNFNPTELVLFISAQGKVLANSSR